MSLVGDMSVVNSAINNVKDDGRMTYLAERLQRDDLESELGNVDLGVGL